MNPKIKTEHLNELVRAVLFLEKTGLAGKYATLTSGGLDRAIAVLPKPLNRRVTRSIDKSIDYCLRFILRPPLGTRSRRPRRKLGLLLASIGGGVGGALGISGAFIELPLMTTLILRSIAETALYYGEDLTTLEGRLACVEVLALGGRPRVGSSRVSYYSTRAHLARLAGNSSYFFLEKGMSAASAPLINRLLTEATRRLGFALSERVLVGALPLVGAAAGSVVSLLLLRHFQNVATAHFTVRKLERMYGVLLIRHHYRDIQNARDAKEKPISAFL